MKTYKFILAILALVTITSCSKDDDNSFSPVIPQPPVVNTKPVYAYDKKPVEIYSFDGYVDKITVNKLVTTVRQTNPNAKTDEELLLHMADSINNIVIYDSQRNWLYAPDIQLAINSNVTDMVLGITIFKPDNSGYVNNANEYAKLGREKFIEYFTKSDIYVMMTTFPDNKENIQSSVLTENYVFDEKGTMVDMFIADANSKLAGLGISKNALKVSNIADMPSYYQFEYRMVHDRFDNRTYTDDKGKKYSTRVFVDKPKNMIGFDSSVQSPESVNVDGKYPIIELSYEDGTKEQYIIIKCTEEIDKGPNSRNKTGIEFRGFTLKNKCYHEIQYASYYNTYFNIRELDFSKRQPDSSFTTVSIRNINIVSDAKEGWKSTLTYNDWQNQ